MRKLISCTFFVIILALSINITAFCEGNVPINGIPDKPVFNLFYSANEITIVINSDVNSPVDGYYIYYKKNDDKYKMFMDSKDEVVSFDNIEKGNTYSFYINSYTKEPYYIFSKQSDEISIFIEHNNAIIKDKAIDYSVKINDYRLEFNIKKMDFITEYNIYYKKEADKNYTLLATTKDLKYTAKNVFKNSTKYNFKIQGISKVNTGSTQYIYKSKFSLVKNITYTSCENISKYSPSLTVFQDFNRIKLTYKKIPQAQKYIIYYKKSNDRLFKRLCETKNLNYTVNTPLSDNTKYDFKVVGSLLNPITNKLNFSKHSLVKSVTYKNIESIEKYTAKFKVEQTKAGFKFNITKIPYANYYYIYYKGKNDSSYKLGGKTNKTEYVLKGKFKLNALYNFKIRAVAKQENGKTGAFYSKYSRVISLNYLSSKYLLGFDLIKKISGGVGINFNDIGKLDEINELINQLNTTDKQLGFYLMNLNSNKAIGYKENQKFHTASVVKVGYCLYVYKLIEQNKASYNDLIEYTKDDFVGYTGIIQNYDFGTKFTLKQVLDYVINVSDNAGYYMLRRTYGTDGYLKMLKTLGASNAQNASSRWGNLTPKDLAIIWKEIYSFKSKSKYGKDFFNTLIDAKYDFIHRTLYEYPMAHKSGYNENGYNDSGIVLNKKPYIIVIMAEECTSSFDKIAILLNKINDLLI